MDPKDQKDTRQEVARLNGELTSTKALLDASDRNLQAALAEQAALRGKADLLIGEMATLRAENTVMAARLAELETAQKMLDLRSPTTAHRGPARPGFRWVVTRMHYVVDSERAGTWDPQAHPPGNIIEVSEKEWALDQVARFPLLESLEAHEERVSKKHNAAVQELDGMLEQIRSGVGFAQRMEQVRKANQEVTAKTLVDAISQVNKAAEGAAR